MEAIGRLLEAVLASPSAWAGFILLALVLLLLLRAVVPVTREFGDVLDTISKSFGAQKDGMEAQRQGWETLLDRQEAFHREVIEKLTERVAELESNLQEKDSKIAALEAQIEALREEAGKKDEEIQSLKRELESVQANRAEVATERDELKQKVEQLRQELEELKKEKKT